MRRYTLLFSCALLFYLAALPVELGAVRVTPSEISGVDKHVLADALAPYTEKNEFPEQVPIDVGSRIHDARLTYTFDHELVDMLDKIYARYEPDYGAFAAIDANTGAVLALNSFIKDGSPWGNLTLRNSYPAASVFKMITAAAALDQNLLEPDTVLRYNGKKTSLYKKQVLKHKDNKWTRRPTLTKAFAESINTVFARIGIYMVGADKLDDYARRFGFNTDISTDIDFDTGSTDINSDEWRIAETASGYTRSNTLSPLHGAMLAGAVINDGQMMAPYLVELATDKWGIPLYLNQPESFGEPISPATARKMRKLMLETVQRGSARKSFRKFFAGELKEAAVGGKTGSLTGQSPAGRYDWFVGYAASGDKKIGFASLTINKEYWTVKSSYVARKFIEAALAAPNPQG